MPQQGASSEYMRMYDEKTRGSLMTGMPAPGGRGQGTGMGTGNGTGNGNGAPAPPTS